MMVTEKFCLLGCTKAKPVLNTIQLYEITNDLL
jgi:hypothetical protein